MRSLVLILTYVLKKSLILKTVNFLFMKGRSSVFTNEHAEYLIPKGTAVLNECKISRKAEHNGKDQSFLLAF